MDNDKFSDWLNKEMSEQGLNDAELARRAKLTRATIGNYRNRKIKKPDNETLKSIADGLRISDVTVFRKAGILDPVDETDEIIVEFLSNFKGLSLIDKQETLEYVRMKKQIAEKRGEYNVR